MDPLPLKLSQASGVPFYRQIVDQISDLIGAGLLVPGARLPSVRALASVLLVSLITVRRAYADLEAAGLLNRRQGQGTFVAEGVAEASKGKARDEARRGLAEAVLRAQRLGLTGLEIEGVVADTLATTGDNHDR